jgi:hypothetical protein
MKLPKNPKVHAQLRELNKEVGGKVPVPMFYHIIFRFSFFLLRIVVIRLFMSL